MKPYSTTPEKSVKEDWIQQPNWAQGGISPGYAQMVNFDKASAFVDPALLELSQFGGNRISMAMIVPGGTYEFGGGALSAPGIRWAGDTDTGLYWLTPGEFYVAVDGVKEVTFNSSGIALSNLTATRVLFAGTAGQITDDADFTFDTSNNFLQVDGLKLADSTNQLVFQSGGVTGTFSWQPSSTNKTIHIPDLSGWMAVAQSALFADGSVAYFSGGFVGATPSFFHYDVANTRLGIGNNSPQKTLHVTGDALRLGSDGSNYVDIFAGSTLTITPTGDSSSLQKSTSNHLRFIVSNSSSGNAGFDAVVSGAGDPVARFSTATTDWALGVDQSDSEKFKISKSTGLGTNDYFIIDSSGNVTFSGTVTTALTASRLVGTDASSVLASVSNLQSWIAGTADQVVTADDGDGTITLSLPQSIASTSSPTFAALTLTTALAETDGGTGTDTYTLGDTLYSDSANSLAKLTGNTTATKMFLSQTGDGANSAAPAWDTIDAGDIPTADLSGTANQISLSASGADVLVGATDITLSLPQDIHTSATPQFLRVGLGAAAGAAVTLLLSVSDALTSPVLDITQASTGDAGLRFAIGSTASYAVGVDNSDSDAFKISYAASGSAALGAGDYLTILTTGETTIAQWLQVGTATDAATQGDLSAGLTGASRFLYDQSAASIYCYNGASDNFQLQSESGGRMVVVPSSTRMTLDKNSSGSIIEFEVYNRSNTASSSALLEARVFGTSAGDAYYLATIDSGSTWAWGADNSDSDAFLICNNSSLSTTGLALRIDTSENVAIGPSGALATTATNGFLYVPACAGTPTGTPTSITGKIPIIVDSTNHKLYFYSGGSWRDAGP